MTEYHFIYPKDSTTDFLDEIITHQSFDNKKKVVHRLETKEHHSDFFAITQGNLPKNTAIVFLGHGMSSGLSGARYTGFEYGPFISEEQLTVFKQKKIVLLSCRSSEYLKKYFRKCEIKAAVGFPNLITDISELEYPEEPERVKGLVERDIEDFRKFLVDLIKYSLEDYIKYDFSFHQLYSRIKLRVQKELVDYYTEHPQGETPFGVLLSDLNSGLTFFGH